MAETYTPPEPVASAARRGLRLAGKVGGIDKAAMKRGTALADRKPHTLADVGRLVSRHAMSAAGRPANIGSDSSPSEWLVQSLLMGGEAGQAWAKGVWRRHGSEAEAARLGLSRHAFGAADIDKYGVCVVVRLSPELAGQFPPTISLGGVNAPHVTLAYFDGGGYRVPTKHLLSEVRTAVAAACASEFSRPFALALTGGIGEFATPPDEPTRPVFAVVQSHGLLALRAILFECLRGKVWADAARDAHGGYAPHATLAYLPKGQTYDDQRPRGQMMADAIEVWCDTQVYAYPIPGEPEAPIMMARRGPALALSREPPPAPEGMPLHNPDGLHVGRAFRVLTADETVRDGSTGEALGNFPVEVLAEFVTVFAARCAAGEGAPRIDHNHGPSRGMDPTILGAVLACYVADDGERGPGLYVVPGYTDHGRDFVAKHATPDGGSVLSNSPEFAVGPVYARSGGDPSEVGELLGGAELFGVALTGSPQQSEAIIDAVRLSRDGQSTAFAAGEVSGMDPEARFAALEAGLAEVLAQVGKLAEGQAAMKERLEGGDAAAVEMAVEGAAAAVEEITAEAVEEVRAAAEEQMSQLTTEEAAEVEEEMPAAMALCIRRGTGNRKAKAAAWAKRGDLARAKLAGRELRTLKQQFTAMQARATEAECDAFVLELRGFGLPPGDEPAIRRYFTAKRSNPTAWAAMHGEDCPLDREVKAIKAQARRVVPLGRAGVTAQPGDSKITRADVRAWAKDNDIDYDKDPARAGAAWAKATGRSTQEIAR